MSDKLVSKVGKSKKFKTDVHVEVPRELRANLFLLTYDPSQMPAGEIVEMKAKIGMAMREIMDEYPAWFKAYNIRMEAQP